MYTKTALLSPIFCFLAGQADIYILHWVVLIFLVLKLVSVEEITFEIKYNLQSEVL